MTADLPDAWGIMANHAQGDNICRASAQCWIMWTNPGGGFDRNMMVVRSRGGRWVHKWMRADRLENWRVKWVPPGLRDKAMGLSDRQEAERVLDRMNTVWAMPEKPKRSRTVSNFAKIEEVSAGTVLIPDSGFNCLNDGEAVTVRADAQGYLYVPCACGAHHLHGQIQGGVYIGLRLAGG